MKTKLFALVALILTITSGRTFALEIKDCKKQIDARLTAMGLGTVDKPKDGKTQIQFEKDTLKELGDRYDMNEINERSFYTRMERIYSDANDSLRDSKLSIDEKNKQIVMDLVSQSEHAREWQRVQTKKATSSDLPGVALRVENLLFAEKKTNLDTGDFFGSRGNELAEILYEKAFARVKDERAEIYESYLLDEIDVRVLLSGELNSTVARTGYDVEKMIVLGRSETKAIKIFFYGPDILFFEIKNPRGEFLSVDQVCSTQSQLNN